MKEETPQSSSGWVPPAGEEKDEENDGHNYMNSLPASVPGLQEWTNILGLTQIRKIDGNVMVCQRERERETERERERVVHLSDPLLPADNGEDVEKSLE